MTSGQRKRRARFVAGPMIIQLAQNADKLESAAQLCENAVDSIMRLIEFCRSEGIEPPPLRERNVWMVIHPGYTMIDIIDTGHGLTKTLNRRDTKTVEEYDRLQDTGSLPTGYNLDSHMTLSGKWSIWHMMERIGRSSNIPDPSSGVMGMRGIGANSRYALSARSYYLFRPHRVLERVALEKDVAQNRVQTYKLMLPTRDMLQSEDTSYDDPITDESLDDPWRHKLPHGSMLRLMDLVPNLDDTLRPKQVAEYFRVRFGNYVKDEVCNIYIVDRATAEARSQGGERILKVEATKYQGHLVYPPQGQTGEIEVLGRKMTIQLHYDPNNTRGDVDILRQSSAVGKLSRIPELINHPKVKFWAKYLATGRLVGSVSFPWPDQEYWDLNKGTLLGQGTAQRSAWIDALNGIVKAAQAGIDLVEKKRADEALRKEEMIIDRALRKALQRSALYSERSGLGTPIPEVKRKVEAGKGQTPRSQSTPVLKVRVIDEHDRGIDGVMVILEQDDRQIEEPLFTGISGMKSLGPRPSGRYTIRITPPPQEPPLPKIVPLTGYSLERTDIILTQDNPGRVVTFKLRTGIPAPPPVRGNIPHSSWAEMAPDEGLYGISRLETLGYVDLNINDPQFVENWGNYPVKDMLIAVCLASAMSQVSLSGTIGFVLGNNAKFAGWIYQAMCEERDEERRRSLKGKRKLRSRV